MNTLQSAATLFLVWITFAISSAAPDVNLNVTSSTYQPKVGEPFVLTFTLVAPAGATVTPLTLTQFDNTSFDMESISAVRYEESSGKTEIIQDGKARLWRAGKYELPPLQISLTFAPDTQPVTLTFPALAIDVQTLLTNGDSQMRPYPSVIHLSSASQFSLSIPVAVMVIGLGIIMIFSLFIYLRSRRPQDKSSNSAAPLDALVGLRSQRISTHEKLSRAVQYLREYLALYYKLESSTTVDEFLTYIANENRMQGNYLKRLSQIFERLDQIRFGSQRIDEDGVNQLMTLIGQWATQHEVYRQRSSRDGSR